MDHTQFSFAQWVLDKTPAPTVINGYPVVYSFDRKAGGGTSVTYQGYPHVDAPVDGVLFAQIVEEAGTVVIPTPEPWVYLPAPSWVDTRESPFDPGIFVWKSHAQQLVREFLDQIKEIM